MSRSWRVLPVLTALLLAAGCGDENQNPPAAACGNGSVEAGEICDDGNTVSGDGCRADCKGSESCGDALVDVGEVCDDGNTASGDGCRADCKGSEQCGDGLVDSGEACDNGQANGNAPDACRTDCTLARCGDGVKDSAEACDNGAQNSDTAADACRVGCELASCGDGVKDSGETCDEGAANSDTEPGACRTNCALATCGDGVVDTGEQCDEGAENSNTVPGACRTTCVSAFCGDGTIDTNETCDQGQANSDTAANACRENCQPAHCGDGVTDTNETCDSGAQNSDTVADACRTNCQTARCGDSVVDTGEGCDQGSANSNVNADACRADCQSARCGDSVVDTGETCDDGNTAPGDGCTEACAVQDGWVCPAQGCHEISCGDGLLDPGEECDDTNLEAGDGCGPTCELETAGWTCSLPYELNTAGVQADGTFQWAGDTMVLGQEFDGTCAASSNNPEGIARFVAPAAGTYAMKVAAEFNSVLWIWNGACPGLGLVELGCVNAKSDSAAETLTVTLTQGQEIFIVVDGYGSYSTNEGLFTLTVAPLACGDGILAPTEACDDHNTVATDGCTDTCTISANYACPTVGQPCRQISCGDGIVDAPEACDDANNAAAGCSDTCLVEAGYVCPTAGQACRELRCGDSIVDAPETCDDGNATAGDGCSANCRLEVAADDCTMPFDLNSLGAAPWTWSASTSALANDFAGSCNSTGTRPDAVGRFVAPADGDYIVTLQATWDTVLVAATGCGTGSTSLGCKDAAVSNGVETLTLTLTAGQEIFLVADGYGTSSTNLGDFTLKVTPKLCGDGILATGEACDDHNTDATDGCTDTCTISAGFVCPTAGQACRQITCGDGIVDGSESCDDANNTAPGCSDTCTVEAGFVCATPGQACVAIVCGDGILHPGESCDDGNATDGDGCTACAFDIAAAASTLHLTGSLDATDPKWTRPGANSTTGACTSSTYNTNRYYDTYTIVNTTSADQHITLTATWTANGFLHVYSEPFDPASQMTGCLSGDDDFAIGTAASNLGSQIVSLPIAAGSRLVIVASAYAASTATGAYSIDVVTLRSPVCGDGFVDGAETCDDGNLLPSDGCSDACAVEAGFICPTPGLACRELRCGDSIVDAPETCDDGNATSGDGCSANCRLEVAADDCTMPFELNSLGAAPWTWSASTSALANDFVGSCASGTRPDAVGRFVAPTDGDYIVSLLATWDTVLLASTGCGTGSTSLGCEDEVASNRAETLTLTLTAGQEVFLVADGYGTSSSNLGDFTLTVTPKLCGDGILATGEACDDHNTDATDGCTDTCALSPGYVCPTAGQACRQVTCGDGIVDLNESCEDGNTVDGDGCSAACVLEIPAPGTKQVKWGSLDTTDAKWNRPSSSCSTTTNYADRHFDAIPVVNNTGAPQELNVSAYWTDSGYLFRFPSPFDPTARAACVVGDYGRDAQLAKFWLQPGEVVTLVISDEDANQAAGMWALELSTVRQPLCGDGFIDGPEACDDLNVAADDGCSPTCAVEPGWICPADQSCVHLCGNSVLDAGEACDDGNFVADDGCSADCSAIQGGWTCATLGQVCVHTCGNSVLDAGEDCDDGNFAADDGCTADCAAVQTGWTCGTAGAACTRICGNGTLDSGEACDDANFVGGDGCAANCSAVEAGWLCPTAGVACVEACGSGTLEDGETCDDGNKVNGDGCSSLCEKEIAAVGANITLTGALTSTDPTFSRPSPTCGTSTYTPYVDSYEIVNNTADAQLIKINANWVNKDGFLLVYRAPFDRTASRTNCIVGNDDFGGTYGSQVDNQLIKVGPSETLAIVATTYYGSVLVPAYTITVTTKTPVCGDSKVTGGEVCDDGNTVDTDGCSATCSAVAEGYVCDTAGQACTAIPGKLVINEVDYDQAGTDAAEFVEIYNRTGADKDLTGLALVLVNGNGTVEYRRLALSGTLPAGGYLVVGVTGIPVATGAQYLDIGVFTAIIQNGDPDGIALVDLTNCQVLDALSYGGTMPAASITAPGCVDGTSADKLAVPLVEGTPATVKDTVTGSLCRKNSNGRDTDDAAKDWSLCATPTPGAAN